MGSAVRIGIAFLTLAAAGCRDSTRPLPVDTTFDLLIEARQSGGPPELLRLDAEGGAPARLFPAGMEASDPVPSPSGSRIVYVVADYTQWIGDIWVADRDGGNATRLTTAPELDDHPSWSPDGQRIAFRSYRAGRDGDIWVMNADGSNPVNLTPDPLPGVTDESRPAWSPNGAEIAYASTAGGDRGIWVMKADGSGKAQRTFSEDLDTEPSWSPDGSEIAFRRSSPTLGSDIWIVPRAAGTERRIARAGEQRQPAWSPDGAMIAFVEGPPGSSASQVWTMRTDGSQPVRRTTSPAWTDAMNPVWLLRVP
jgi:Tol biopolymer transport system component